MSFQKAFARAQQAEVAVGEQRKLIKASQSLIKNILSSNAKVLADEAKTIQEAKVAFRFAPRHSEGKWYAFLKWIRLCSTVEELAEADRIWTRERSRFFFFPEEYTCPEEWDGPHPENPCNGRRMEITQLS